MPDLNAEATALADDARLRAMLRNICDATGQAILQSASEPAST